MKKTGLIIGLTMAALVGSSNIYADSWKDTCKVKLYVKDSTKDSNFKVKKWQAKRKGGDWETTNDIFGRDSFSVGRDYTYMGQLTLFRGTCGEIRHKVNIKTTNCGEYKSGYKKGNGTSMIFYADIDQCNAGSNGVNWTINK